MLGSPPLGYERHFAAPPCRVLPALLTVLAGHGRVHDIREFGRTVEFTPTRCAVHELRRLTADLRPWHGETLVSVNDVPGERIRVSAEEAEHAHLLHLLSLVHDELER